MVRYCFQKIVDMFSAGDICVMVTTKEEDMNIHKGAGLATVVTLI